MKREELKLVELFTMDIHRLTGLISKIVAEGIGSRNEQDKNETLLSHFASRRRWVNKMSRKRTKIMTIRVLVMWMSAFIYLGPLSKLTPILQCLSKKYS